MYYLCDVCVLCLSAVSVKDTNVNTTTIQELKKVLPNITTLDPGTPLRVCHKCRTTLQSYETFTKMCQKNICHISNYIHKLQENSETPDQKFYELQINVEDFVHKLTEPEITYIIEEEIGSSLAAANNDSEINDLFFEDATHSSLATENEESEIYWREPDLEMEEEFHFTDQVEIKEEFDLKQDETDQVIYNQLISQLINYESESGPSSSKNINKVPINQELVNKSKPFPCHLCHKKFQYKSSLLCHIMNIHNKPLKSKNLNSCPSSSKNENEIPNNQKLLNNSKPFPCHLCDKKFKYKSSLMSHMKIHNNPEYLVCLICGKKFLCKHYFKIHMKIHEGVKDIHCPICNKEFRSRSNLSVHMRSHTGIKDYSCELCGKNFTQGSNLKTHMKSHTGVKPYECSICKKKYSERWYLKTHMQIHTGTKDFPCSLCFHAFRTKSNLMIHVKRYHADLQIEDISDHINI